MTLFLNKHRIETTRLRDLDYFRVGMYFVTVCTSDRAHFFGEILEGEMHLSPMGEIVAEKWQKTPQIRPNVELDAWMMMPNHLHGIVVITHQMQLSKPTAVGAARRAAPTRRNVSTSRDVETFRRNVSRGSHQPERRRLWYMTRPIAKQKRKSKKRGVVGQRNLISVESYKAIEEELDFSKSVIDSAIGETTKIGELIGAADTTSLEHGEAIRAQGATLRELHALLKAKDPGFGGLVRVMNKRQEFLWVHARFEKEY